MMDAEHHDLVLAVTSHLPHLIAYTIVGTASDLEEVTQSEVIKYSAGGFRDFTRIAASDPTMWRDVFLANKDAVLEMLQRFTKDLAFLAAGDPLGRRRHAVRPLHPHPRDPPLDHRAGPGRGGRRLRPPGSSIMTHNTDDLRILEIKELSPPSHVLREFPISGAVSDTGVRAARTPSTASCTARTTDCWWWSAPARSTITAAAREYAARLAEQRQRLADRLEIVMRVYFEKPRTTVGWKGLINDPDLDGSFQHQQGPAHGTRAAARHQRARPAGRYRISRHDHAAIYRRPRLLGRDRGTNDGIAGPSRAGLGPVLPGRLQERHRRQYSASPSTRSRPPRNRTISCR